ncbi:MAG: acylphosphatase [Candidatus Bathyarchaeia archaeon]|nr:acylphosphatase [Candidatus Bathyarchaeota archaeon]
MRRRTHIYISGQVQGVFFRYETRRVAKELGVSGWVRNLPDGRVEVVAEGEEESIEKLIQFCRRGPPAAKVTNVEVKYEEPKGENRNFIIIY